jgi:excisionase family DNA binding protein
MLLNAAEAAAILKVSKRTVLGWIAKGNIKAIKLSSKTIRIRLDDLPISQEEKALILGGKPTPDAKASPDLLV